MKKVWGCILCALMLIGMFQTVIADSCYDTVTSKSCSPDRLEKVKAFLQNSSLHGQLKDYSAKQNNQFWIGGEIPVYEAVDAELVRSSDSVYPVLDASGEYLFEVVYHDLGEGGSVMCTNDASYNIKKNCLKNVNERIAIIYSDTEQSLLVDDEMIKIVDYSQTPVLSRCSITEITADKMNAIPEIDNTREEFCVSLSSGTRGDGDAWAYTSVDVIRQPADSMWCWAACMASIVNKETGSHYTCQSMAHNYTYDTDEGASYPVYKSRLEAKTGHSYTSIANGYMLPALSSIGLNHPVSGAGYNADNDYYHSIVVRGIDLDGLTFSFMDPNPACSVSYRTSSIYSYNYSNDTGVMWFQDAANGIWYAVIRYLHW